uniref:Uncharacterized protein n=1 Tax=Glossina brevipalpis TaxID=37001 RepID=A0A1A9WLP6_9MUSC
MFAKRANIIGVPMARLFSQKHQRPERCCPKVIEPRCDPKDESICKDHKLKLTDKIFTTKLKDSMWEFPECCGNICHRMPVRMDEIYYKMSDKRRTYTQTWTTPPSLRIEVCEIYPPLCRADQFPTGQRRTKSRTLTACRLARHVDWLRPCKGHYLKGRCPRFAMENCRNVYRMWKAPVRCKKVPTPYPSYSDCERCGQVPPRTTECKCLDRPAMCEVWEQLRRQRAIIKRGEPDIGPFFGKIEEEYKGLLAISWYSECKHCEAHPPKPIECKCLDKSGPCAV